MDILADVEPDVGNYCRLDMANLEACIDPEVQLLLFQDGPRRGGELVGFAGFRAGEGAASELVAAEA